VRIAVGKNVLLSDKAEREKTPTYCCKEQTPHLIFLDCVIA
jgi:hypothetical protein